MAGDGPAAAALTGGVPDLRGELDYTDKDPLIELILDGQGDMPAFRAEFDKHDARRVLVYMERLEDGRDQPSTGGEKPDPKKKDDDDQKPEEPEGGI